MRRVTHMIQRVINESALCAAVFSGAALHLNAAWKAAGRASAPRSAIQWARSPTVFAPWGHGSHKATNQVREEAISVFFDYMEDAMIAASASD